MSNIIDLNEINKLILIKAKQDFTKFVDKAEEIFKDEASTQHTHWKAPGGKTETGKLAESIIREDLSNDKELHEKLTATAEYAPYVAYGRGEVKPKRKKALYGNNEFFRTVGHPLKKVGPFTPGKDNFLDISVERIKKIEL